MPVEALLSRLEGVKGTGPSWRARCPSHGSKGATLSIRENPDGMVLLYCHAGCTFDDVIGSVGLRPSDLFPEQAVDHRVRPQRARFNLGAVAAQIKQEALIAAFCAEQAISGNPIDSDRGLEACANLLRLAEELKHATD